MIESKTHTRKFIGIALMSIGLIGFSYLGWTYFVWGKTLPAFPSDSVLSEGVTLDEHAGFAAMLENESEGDQPIEQDVEGQHTLSFDRVLGDHTTTAGEQGVTLSVPRLGIEGALVELNVDGDDDSIYESVLTRSVAHLQKSAYPGEFGNTFLFGHSKLPVLAGSDYESIFTNLPKVKVGDVVEVTVDGTAYTYQISQTGVVEPTDTFIMNQPQTKKMLTLMTCIPPGFANQRYITVGELVSIN